MLLLWFQFYSNVQLALTPFLLCDKFYIFLCINILILFFLLFYLFILMRNRSVLILDFWFYRISISTRLFEKC